MLQVVFIPVIICDIIHRRYLWLRCLRRDSAAARFLGLRVRIPPGAWMSVSCECCVLSGRGLCVGLITRPEESYRVWCVWVWSCSLDNDKALANRGLSSHTKMSCFMRSYVEHISFSYGLNINVILQDWLHELLLIITFLFPLTSHSDWCINWLMILNSNQLPTLNVTFYKQIYFKLIKHCFYKYSLSKPCWNITHILLSLLQLGR
jgi:hypothetical protein